VDSHDSPHEEADHSEVFSRLANPRRVTFPINRVSPLPPDGPAAAARSGNLGPARRCPPGPTGAPDSVAVPPGSVGRRRLVRLTAMVVLAFAAGGLTVPLVAHQHCDDRSAPARLVPRLTRTSQLPPEHQKTNGGNG
jgi:hypothetical protein